MLQTKNLTKIYKKKRKQTVALEDVTLNFGDNGLIFIVGKSGCGKSTLLNLLGGLIRPTDGDVIINGQSGVEFSEGKLDNYRNSAVGFVFQKYNLFENSTVGANVKLARELQGKNADREVVDEILRKVELCDEDGKTYYDRRVNMLSGGQRQRVAIARALIKEPEIILADEPTGALDSDTGEEVFNLLKEISKQKLVIVVSHDRHSAQKFGDRIIELSEGKIVSDSGDNAAPAAAAVECKQYVASKLPVKYAAVTCVSGLKNGIMRFILSILISVLCLIIFGVVLTASFCDKMEAELKTMQAEKMDTLVIRSDQPFSEEYDNALEKSALNHAYAYSDFRVIGSTNIGFDPEKNYNNPYRALCFNNNWFAELNPDTGEEVAKLTPDSRFKDKGLCRLPREYDEIAITDAKADAYIKYGYVTDDGQRIEINTPDDLIGKTIKNGNVQQDKTPYFKICGVYSTGQSADYYRKFDVDNYGMTENEIREGKSYKLKGKDSYIHGSAGGSVSGSIVFFNFVCEGFFEYNYYRPPDGTLIMLSGNINKDLKALKNIENSVDGNLTLVSGVSTFMYPLDLMEELKPFVSAATSAVSVFVLLVILNFLIASVGDRNKEMGILRSLGAGRKSLVFICFVESVALALINFALSAAGTAVICAIVNAAYYIKFINVGIKTVSSLFAISVLFSLLSTAFLSLVVTRRNKR